MSTIDVGSTVYIQFRFVSNDVLVDPDTITGQIYKDGVLDSSFSVDAVSTGIYGYSWVTSEAGTFELRVVGTFLDSTPTITHRKYFLIGDTDPAKTLNESYLISMLGILDPLYLDPEIIYSYYPEVDLVEATELIHWYSKEVLYITGETAIAEITPLMHDFILASVLCDLSKIYTFGGGLGGFTKSDGFTLGDFQVNSGSGSGSNASGRAGATTWCELASMLREDFTSSKAGMKAIVKGSNFENPIPVRALKRID